jgi:DNA topoisomerase-1
VHDAYGAPYLPGAPREYTSRAKNAQEAHEAIRPTDFGRDRAGSGDHARLYELIWKRALASQMASARLERTTAELADGTGRHILRATGQVVLFPGFLALYEEGRDDAEDEESRRLPRLREGDTPAKKKVEAEQHFTQPPPRYSEASLVKRMEELGIGRPSTYAATLQTLKDRDYVRLEKNRFFPEESGRLLTAFLERFFERYVSFDFTAHLEDELDDISGGRAAWRTVLEAFWRDFKPKTAEVMEQKPSEITAALDEFLAPYLFPEKEDGSDPRLCPSCGEGRLGLRGGKYGAFVACSNYPECKFTRRFGQAGEGAEDSGPQVLGSDPDSGLEVTLRTGRFGPYFQLGEGKEAKRASLPKDVPGAEADLEVALRLLALPRTVGDHPESGKPITASIGRYGPYLAHDGKYAKLASTAEVFEVGMNAAVAKLADAASGGGRRAGSREPLKVLGLHPRTELEIKLMEGRFGPYVTDGTTNATLPKSVTPDELTLEEAAQLIDERAAKGPAPKKGRGRKAPARKKGSK